MKVDSKSCWTGVQFPPPPPCIIFMATDHRKEYQRSWVASRREHYISLLGGKCCKCGSTESLQFDHIDRTQKISHRIFSYSHEKIQLELSKCQLLCSKCHVIKTNTELYSPRKHGTTTMYRKEGCRCDLCKQAKRDSR